MADTKISALPASTTPLAGTEVLPIVQSSTTRQVSVANLTAGRVISANGVAFPATVSTSSDPNTLDDYEEGTFTATLTTTSGSITLLSNVNDCGYTKIGRQVTVTGLIIVQSVSLPTGGVSLNLPFSVGGDVESSLAGGTFVIFQDAPTYVTTLEEATFEEGAASLTINMNAASIGADDQFRFSFTYFT
jgi:hypothetical protein